MKRVFALLLLVLQVAFLTGCIGNYEPFTYNTDQTITIRNSTALDFQFTLIPSADYT